MYTFASLPFRFTAADFACRNRLPRRPSRRAMCRVMASIVSVALGASTLAKAESWTDIRGERTIEAQMLGLWGDQLVLRTPDGRRLAVSLANLRGESRLQAQRLQQQIEEGRSGRVNEMKRAADDETAAAPSPLPDLEAPVPYEPYAGGKTLQEQLDWSNRMMMGGHVRQSFDALPPKYQQLSNESVKAVVAADPEQWKGVRDSLHKLGSAIETKQRWFLSHPRFANIDGSQREFLEDVVLNIAGVLRRGFAPEVLDVEKIAAGQFGEVLAAFDQATAGHVAAAMSGLGMTSPVVTTEQRGEQHVALTDAAGQTIETIYQQVDGYWIPSQMVAAMPEDDPAKLNDAITSALSAGPLSVGLLSTVIDPIVDPLLAAETEAEYHRLLETALTPVQPLVQMAASAMTSPRGRSSGGMSDMDMQMQMEMEYQNGAGNYGPSAADLEAMEAGMRAAAGN